MRLNLLTDAWIPAVKDGISVTLRPDQVAEPGVSRLAWRRADFNLACLELLIGLVSMAAPPRNEADWFSRLERPDPDRLRAALLPFAPHFEIAGDGPRFMQDLEAFENVERKKSIVKPADMLFLDSPGAKTVRLNADLAVKRNRNDSLALPVAAVALYAMQAWAPVGGAGNRASMRGGGPLVTLVRPIRRGRPDSLWRLVFANVLPGRPLSAGRAGDALPWLRPTVTSKENQAVTPLDTHPLEAFFGMPRRLRLQFEHGRVAGIVQRPHGTLYRDWEHPLTPYSRTRDTDSKWWPVHPGPLSLAYFKWPGINFGADEDQGEIRRAASAVREYAARPGAPEFEILAGGWAMDRMKPLDFSFQAYPGFPLPGASGLRRIRALADAGGEAAAQLRGALKTIWRISGSFGTAIAPVVEAFYAETEYAYVRSARRILAGEGAAVESSFYRTVCECALRKFDEQFAEGLADHSMTLIRARVEARKKMFYQLRQRISNILGPGESGKAEEPLAS